MTVALQTVPPQTTVRDIITLALKTANVLGVGQAASPEDMLDSFRLLNMLMAQLQRRRYMIYQLIDVGRGGKPIYKLRNPDQEIIVRKTVLARVIGLIFPAIGPGQTPNIPMLGALPDQVGLGNAILGINPLQEAIYNADAATASKTLPATEICGAAQCFLAFTGTFGAGGAITLPTVANLVAALPAAVQSNPVGITWQLRVINVGTTQTLTMTTNTGWTLGGTMTLATATFRDFVVTITSATTASLQNVGSGTP